MHKYGFATLLVVSMAFAVPGFVSAQNATDGRTDSGQNSAVRDDRGINPGWIGLAGLLGLAGLFRGNDSRHTGTSRTDPTRM